MKRIYLITSMQIFTNMHVDNVQMLHDVNGNISEIRNNLFR